MSAQAANGAGERAPTHTHTHTSTPAIAPAEVAVAVSAPKPASPSLADGTSPEAGAGFWSRISFWWVNRLFVAGNAHTLTQSDLLPLMDKDDVGRISSTFERLLHEAIEAKDPHPVTRALKQQFAWPMALGAATKFVNSSIQFGPPLLLYGLLQSLQNLSSPNPTHATWEPFIYAVALFITISVRTVVENMYFHRVIRVGYNIREAITTAVYRKSLRLSPVARQDTPTGQIVNLMQLDATRLDTFMSQLCVLWDSPYQICGYMIILGFFVSYASLAGLGSMLLLIPLNIYMMVLISKYRRATVIQNDQRIKVTNESLQGIRAIKLYNWEDAFTRIVTAIRDKELKAIWNYSVVGAVNNTIMQTAPVVVAVVTLVVYAAMGGDFTPDRIFAAITVLNQLRFPLMFLPMAIQQLADARVSLARLNKFMQQPEVENYAQKIEATQSSETSDIAVEVTTADANRPVSAASLDAVTTPMAEIGIAVRHGQFYWEQSDARKQRLWEKAEADRKAALARQKQAAARAAKAQSGAAQQPGPTPAGPPQHGGANVDIATLPKTPEDIAPAAPVLDGCDFVVPRGKLFAVVGPVGSGKSALCAAILGELHKASGDVVLNGRVAYVSQTAWILNATVRRNITFAWEAATGRFGEVDQERYERVLRVCQLQHDITTLPHGDSTEIGERGINLSGGQKQRVSIARAAYSGADVYLFDDPLSALDAEVGKAVFENCIAGELAGKTRLLITNQLQYLRACDGVIVLEKDPKTGGGRIACQGSFDTLLATQPAFADLMRAYGESARVSASRSRSGSSQQEPGPVQSAHERKHSASQAAEVTAEIVRDESEAVMRAESKASESESTFGAAAPAKGTSGPLTTPNADGTLEPTKDHNGSTPSGDNSTGQRVQTAAAAAQAAAAAPTNSPAAAASAPAQKTGGLMTLEEKSDGAVQFQYYVRYIRSAGSVTITFIVLFFAYLLAQASQLLTQWWLTFWSSDPSYTKHPSAFYMGIFGAIGASTAVFAFIRVITMSVMGIRASRELHRRLFYTILRAPLSFFDTTPLGRIIARFSKDLDSIDNLLVSNLGMLVFCVFMIFGSLAAIIFSTPWFALVVLPVLFVYYRVMNYFRNVAREVKRIDSITRSPIFAHFSETLGGLSVIRAYALSDAFARQNESHVGKNISAFYTLKACDRWLSIRLELLGNIIILAAGLLAAGTSTSRSEGSAAGLAGFSLSYALAITGMFNWTVRTFAETEQTMNSVERVLYYVDNVAQEPYDPRPDVTLPKNWPSKGSVVFKDYRMRYRPNTPEVLHGVSFAVRGGEKIGIVGRTGAGKSSIMVSLFRLIEDSCHNGLISIDDVDIDTLGLSQLRSQLAIIPQDPVMFSGTVRTNLDPIGALAHLPDHGDAQLWDVLTKVGLKDVIERLPNKLNAQVAEFGDNFSVGQRQLMCLARVLLRRCKIVLLDEASSALDFASDMALQRAIRESFADCTILTIAHRLNTIISSDRVVCMDAGVVAEYAHPHELLSRPESIFSSLVDEMGPEAAGSLRAQAAAAFAATQATSPNSLSAAPSAAPAAIVPA